MMKRTRWLCRLIAFLLLAACTSGDRQQRLAQLEELERQNVADSLMTNDSLAQALADFFDRHGTSNERMRAHYILGRTYADLGEAPAAINAYLNAATSADTTAQDCDWAKLCRVHAQSAKIYHRLAQPRSQLEELKTAEYCARRSKDTLVVIECISQRADAYSLLHQPDSAIYIREQASQIYEKLGATRRAAIALAGTLGALIDRNDLERAKQYMNIYEGRSGLFDDAGNIRRGSEIYYYIKGRYYLATNRLDSAESMFRKLEQKANTLNHKIASAKGLQHVYSIVKMPDSIAKYAELSYELNDSAYSLSEMENIQRLKISYNYSRSQILAEKQAADIQHARTLIIFLVIFTLVSILALILVIILIKKRQQLQLIKYRHYQEALEQTQMELLELRASENASLSALIKRKDDELLHLEQQIAEYQQHHQHKLSTLEERLQESPIVEHMRQLLKANPPQQATIEDFKQLRYLINETIPSFYDELKCLRQSEYDICLLIRTHFSPSEVCKLAGIKETYISHLRQRILQKVYGVSEAAKELDERLLSIH